MQHSMIQQRLVSLNEFGFSSALWLGVGWDSGDAVLLDSEVVLAHLHVEEAVIAPVGTP